MFLRGAPTVDRARQKLLFEGVDRALAEAVPVLSKMPFEIVVGTGGSVDTLSELCPTRGGHAGYPRAVDTGAMRALVARLFTMTAEERREAFGLRPDRADTIVTAARQAHPDVEITSLVVRGAPEEHLVRLSINACATVVGRTHQGGPTAWTRSVAHAVMKRTHCPLIIVPTA